MTETEIEMSQASLLLVACCKKKPHVQYDGGATWIECEKCERKDFLEGWRPRQVAERWNALVLGPRAYRRLKGWKESE